nr:MAG TPA: hypothetical protein [Caudoviricetes sp.]
MASEAIRRGSNPRCFARCGCSSKVEQQPSKLTARVQIPPSAPSCFFKEMFSALSFR